MNNTFSIESILFKDMYSNNNNTISNTKITKSLDDCVYDAYKSSEDLKFYETYTMINDYNNTQKLRMLNKLRYATNNIKNKQAHNSCESYIRSLEEDFIKNAKETIMKILKFIGKILLFIPKMIYKFIRMIVEKIKTLIKPSDKQLPNLSMEQKKTIKEKILNFFKRSNEAFDRSFEYDYDIPDLTNKSETYKEIWEHRQNERDVRNLNVHGVNTKSTKLDVVNDKINEINAEIRENKNFFIRHYYYELFKADNFSNMSLVVKKYYERTFDEITSIKLKVYPLYSKVHNMFMDCLKNSSSPNESLMNEFEHNLNVSDITNKKFKDRKELSKSIPKIKIIENMINMTLNNDFSRQQNFISTTIVKFKKECIESLKQIAESIDNESKTFENLVNNSINKPKMNSMSKNFEDLCKRFSKLSSNFSTLIKEKCMMLNGIFKVNAMYNDITKIFMDAVIKYCNY